jgi:hypothetical protein
METFRSVWGRLMADLYKALPAPQKQVLDANPEVAKSVPRGERNMVVIEQLTSTYMPNLAAVLAGDLSQFAGVTGIQNVPIASAMPMPSAGGEFGAATPGAGGEFGGGGAAPVDPNAPPDPNAPRGFLVRAVLITPHRDGPGFVNQTFLKNLLAIAPTAEHPKVPYSIPKVKIITAEKIGKIDTRLSDLRQSYDQARARQNMLASGAQFSGGGATGGMGGFGPGATGGGGGEFGGFPGGGGQFGGQFGGNQFGGGGFAGGANQDDPAPFQDRKTGEDVREDWEINVLFVVQLDPPPPAPKPDQQSASAGGT